MTSDFDRALEGICKSQAEQATAADQAVARMAPVAKNLRERYVEIGRSAYKKLASSGLQRLTVVDSDDPKRFNVVATGIKLFYEWDDHATYYLICDDGLLRRQGGLSTRHSFSAGKELTASQ